MKDEKIKGDYTPPADEKKHPLDAEQTDEFYQTACEMSELQHELPGRILLDYGLRVDEFVHLCQGWVKRKRHPKTGKRTWCIDVPMGESCWGGNKDAGQRNEGGADLHETNDPCKECRRRSYKEKDWVDDEYHEENPFHPKSENSFGKTWMLPTSSAKEATELLNEFLAPSRQWPVGHNRVRDTIHRIAEESDLDRDVKPHALRHTYGCRLAAAGKNPQAMMSQLRHGNLAITMYYSELRGTRVRDQIRSSWDVDENF